MFPTELVGNARHSDESRDLFLRDARVSRRATPRDAHTRAIVGVPSADDLDVGRHEQREVRRPARSSRPRLATLGAGTDHSRRSVFSRGEARECDAETSPLHLRSSLHDDAPRGQSSTSDGTSSAQVSVSVRSARLPIPRPPVPRFLGSPKDPAFAALFGCCAGRTAWCPSPHPPDARLTEPLSRSS